MGRYIVKRLAFSILVLLGVSILIFCLARLVPSDPAIVALGAEASDEALAALRAKMHLTEPIFVQYYYWLVDALHGDFGVSLNTNRPVLTDIKQFLPATLELIVIVLIFQLIFSLSLGVLAARHKDTWIDALIRVFSYIGVSLPTFVMAVLMVLFFGNVWRILPVLGRFTAGVVQSPTVTGFLILDSIIGGNLAAAWDGLLHALPPAAALSISHIVQECRVLRSSMIDNMGKEFISVTKSFGVAPRRIMSKYLFKASSTSLVTVFGLDLAATLGNAFLVEQIFNWPGLSRYGYQAMLASDLNAVSAVVLIIGLLFMVCNILVDLVIAAIDPRVRLGD